MPQAGPVAQSPHGAHPVQDGIFLVAPPSPRGEGFATQFFDPLREAEVIGEQGAGVPCGEDETSPGRCYRLDAFAGLEKPCGRARGIYAPPSRVLLPVRGMPDLTGHSVVGLLETDIPQQRLHPEGVVAVTLAEQVYLEIGRAHV